MFLNSWNALLLFYIPVFLKRFKDHFSKSFNVICPFEQPSDFKNASFYFQHFQNTPNYSGYEICMGFIALK